MHSVIIARFFQFLYICGNRLSRCAAIPCRCRAQVLVHLSRALLNSSVVPNATVVNLNHVSGCGLENRASRYEGATKCAHDTRLSFQLWRRERRLQFYGQAQGVTGIETGCSMRLRSNGDGVEHSDWLKWIDVKMGDNFCLIRWISELHDFGLLRYHSSFYMEYPNMCPQFNKSYPFL